MGCSDVSDIRDALYHLRPLAEVKPFLPSKVLETVLLVLWLRPVTVWMFHNLELKMMSSSLFLPLKMRNSLFYYFYYCGISTMFSCIVQHLCHLCVSPTDAVWIRGRSHCSSLVRINRIQPAGGVCQYHNCIIFSCSSTQRRSARLSSEC